MDNLQHPEIAASLMIRFELVLLEELGFGLDLETCAATGETGELAYVSPKSGRAIGRTAGNPWHDIMLGLPGFLNRYSADWARVPNAEELQKGFALCGYFLDRHIYAVRGIQTPDERTGFERAIMKEISKGNANE